MTLSQVSSLNSLYSDIYERARFVTREQSLMPSLVTRMGATGWMSRKIGIWSQATAVAIAEDQDLANAAEFSKSVDVTLTPGEIGAQFILTDRMVDTDPDGARAAAGYELGMAIATKIDTDLATDMASFSKEKGASGAALTIAKCAAALAYLRKTSIPGPFIFVLHPYGWHDVWTELGQPASQKALLGDIANEALRQYFVGRFLAADWFVSANISIDGTPDAVSGVFNRMALAIDMRRAPRLEPFRDPSARAVELNMTAGYAHGVWRDSYGVKLTHDATEP